MVRIAKRVFNARHREVRLPVVMHHDAAHAAQHVTAIGADTVVSQPSRGRDMQPLQRFDDAKSSFVEVLDRGEEDQLTHCVGKAEQAPHLHGGSSSRWSRRREVHAEEVDHQRRETIQWHELKGGEIDDDGGDPIAALSCTGALTPSGNPLFVTEQQAVQLHQ